MTPPRVARALVDALVARHLRDAVVGDLDEIFDAERADGLARARRRYWLRALGIVLRLGLRPGQAGGGRPTWKGDGPLQTLWADFRHGARLFAAQPGYAVAAALTLALAIGANSLIFTMANVLVLKPLPLAGSERLAWIFGSSPEETSWRGPLSLPEYVAYRDGVPAIGHLSAWQRRTATLSDGGRAERVVAHAVIGDLHGLWELPASPGRGLTRADEAPGAPAVVVLSHRFWLARFGGRPDVVGHDLRIDGTSRTIAGVLTPRIELGNLSEVDIWLPHQDNPSYAPRADRSWRVVGRLAAGATLETAHAQVVARATTFAAEHGEPGRTARVGPTRDALGAPNVWVVLALLITVVGLLLLLACANVMNLLIARLIARRPELAVRTALGATRGRIVRQIVAESLVLGLAGGLLGLGLAQAGLAAVHAVAYEPFFRQLTIDGRVLAFAVGLAFLAPLAFSVVPAVRMLRADVRTALIEASARSIGSRGTARGQAALVVVQVTLAVTLLVVAVLVVQSMQAVTRIDPGYRAAGLLSAHVEVPPWKVADTGEAARVGEAIRQRAAAIAGVEGAALASELPALQPLQRATFIIGAQPPADPSARPSAGLTVASASYFTVMGLPIIAGRGFEPRDETSAAPVVVLSQAAAGRYFSDAGGALGAQIVVEPGLGQRVGPATVIGIAADVANTGGATPPQPQLYVLAAHHPRRAFYLFVRAGRPEAMAAELRAAVHAVDPELPTYQLRTVAEAFADEHSSNRLLSGLFVAFAVVAMLLATAGLYGVMSYAVSQRTPELALRMALGASPRRVAASVAGRTLRLAAMGGALGLVLAFALAHSMRSILFGVEPDDPLTYAGVSAVLTLAALLAAWVPVRRAAAVDPASGLRQA